MSTLIERFQNIWDSIRQGPARIPTFARLPDERVDRASSLGGPFQRNEHYFQVRINEMFLLNGRQWFSQYDPMVCVVSEFIYDKQIEVVPFVVGPSLVEQHLQQVPTGMIFANERVAGLHPYRGGKLTLSVVLCQVQRQNYVRELLQLVEGASGALDFSTALSAYVKVANVVIGGIEAMLGQGTTRPLVGLRMTIDPDAGDVLQPGYFVLIDEDEAQFDPDKLWVRDNKLVYGDSLATAAPFREADYVLYSIVHTTQRSDESMLSFYSMYEQVVEAAAKPDAESWKRAKANMLTLYQMMLLSPDLIPSQVNALSDRYIQEMKQIRARVENLGTLGAAPPQPSDTSPEVDAQLRQATGILDL